MRRLGLALLLLAGGRAAAQPVPFLWAVDDADSRVYLLGSIHVLTPDDYPLAPAVEAAYADATVVGFEVALDAAEDEMEPLIERHGVHPSGVPLRRRLPRFVVAPLDSLLRAHGMRLSQFDGAQPWVVASVVGGLALKDHPAVAAWGVDQHFHDRAVADGRERVALESMRGQMEETVRQTYAEQVGALIGEMAGFDDAPAAMDSLLALWRSGDEAALTAYVEAGGAPASYAEKGMLNVRNRLWIAPLEALLAREGENAFVVVGAAHLVGAQSVIALLRARGHTVTRVR